MPYDSRSLGAEGGKIGELSATPFHVFYETGTDFDYYLGGGHTEWHTAFAVNWSERVETYTPLPETYTRASFEPYHEVCLPLAELGHTRG